MSNLEKYKYQLDIKSAEIFETLSGRLIRDIPDADLFEICRTATAYGYANAGYKLPEGDEALFQVREVMLELQRSFPTLREAEPLLAIRRGVLKEYGDYMGLSVAVFIHFIRQYSINNNRLDALKEFVKLQLPEKLVPTPEEIRADYITRLNELFNNYKQKKNLSPQECSFYFKQLWRERIITFTPEVTKGLKDQALKEVLGNIDFTKAKNMSESKKMRDYYESIRQNSDSDDKVLNYAKYMGLLKWFEFLVETDQTVNDLINEQNA